ncbi:uncharacterized protein LOC124946136 [Impatiens glandulifera]|uniref:uncharacterized protein LOC124946136 n=1 Tax=Impatiens glandulifera TaxID=253017 RepID=UPI001FB12593|nr:uncharacterized protein LOC124946136 [Impatiens glandulifera]
MGQLLSAICGEKFVTSPAPRSYSGDGHDSENEAGLGNALLPWKGGDEEENPLIYQSSTGLVFQIRFEETAAKKVVDECSKNSESIIDEGGSSDVYSLGNKGGIEAPAISLNGDVEKPEIFQSRGSVFQVSFQPAAKKVTDQGNQQRKEVCHLKDVAINKKWKKKFGEDSGKINEAIVEDGVSIQAALLPRKGDQEKPVFQVHIDPAAKEGNGKPLVDQNNEQRKEAGYSKDVTLRWKKNLKKEIVEEGIVIKPIIKCDKEERNASNVTKKKENVDNRCNNKVIIKSLNVKKKEIDDDFHNYDSSGSNSSSDSTAKDENGKPIANQSNIFLKNKTSNKACTLAWRKKSIVIEEGKNEPIINAFISTKKKKIDENEDSPLIIKARGSVFQVCVAANCGNDNHLAAQRNKQMDHHKDDTINKTLIVKKEEQTVIFKEPSAKKVDDNRPLADFSNKQIKQFDTINKAITKIDLGKKKIDENKEKPFIIKARGSVFQVCIAAKSGIDNHLADQRNKQRKEIDHHKDDTINKTLIVKEDEKHVILKEPAAKKVDDNKQLQEFDTMAITQIDLGNNNIVWLKHYNNKQKILMVGEGDFSFSASLAVAFGSSASNITATSFNNSAYLRCNYKKSTGNIEELTNRGATVRHGVDATKMSKYLYWKDIKFDRIIYNFPYSSCPKTESRQTQMRQHLELVRGFLLNAKEMLGEGGEIHISHKTNGFHKDWKLKELAWLEGLWLVGETEFNKSDYPGYETKQGYNGDLNFEWHPSSTYMFASFP